MSKIEQNLLLDIKILDRFEMTIKHKECEEVCGLVKGGLTGRPRIFCFKCDTMVDDEVITIELGDKS
jgi:hypothetical protein